MAVKKLQLIHITFYSVYTEKKETSEFQCMDSNYTVHLGAAKKLSARPISSNGQTLYFGEGILDRTDNFSQNAGVKKGNNKRFGNYRLIKLLSNIYKLFSEVLEKRVIRSVYENQLHFYELLFNNRASINNILANRKII